MKRVVTKESDTILLRDVEPYMYIGTVTSDGLDKGFVTRERWSAADEDKNCLYTVRSVDNLTGGNGWDQHTAVELETLLENLVLHGWKLFVTEDKQEFFNWWRSK